MAIVYKDLKAWAFPEEVSAYTDNDCIRYALSLGFAADPLNAKDLPFVHEDGLRIVPTILATIGSPGPWTQDPRTGINWIKLLHGEQRMRFHRPLAVSGAARSSTKVSRIVDKGEGKGALLVTERTVTDAETGELLASIENVSFCRADGGFATPHAPGDAPLAPLPANPERDPDAVMVMPTAANAALLYRLNGDRNPIHALPDAARKAGFDRPILHGLCTYGMAARAVIQSCCDGQSERMASFSARFSSPVFPGETLRVEMWREEGQVSFRTLVVERGVVVLSHGVADIR
ncbi:MAG: MaoC/PaaZ C-terminal domain-containing protein [Cupriavidus necator]